MPKISLTNPVDPWHINQGFGVNGTYYQANGINIIGHNGIDLQAYHGQPIQASHDGLAFYEIDGSGGHGVVIISDKPYDYKGQQVYMKSIYWHMVDQDKEPKYTSPVYTAQQNGAGANKGVPVKQGDLIGFANSTGLSSGDHLHFGLKPVVPGAHILSGDAPDVVGDYVNVEPNNGYLGAINPMPYMYAQQLVILSTLQKLIDLYKQLKGIK